MRLIDADALVLADKPIGKLMMYGGEYVYTQTAIDAAPTIDAVPVVRCADCVWYQQRQDDKPWKVSKRYCNRSAIVATKPDDYCSYGKRREDGDT